MNFLGNIVGFILALVVSLALGVAAAAGALVVALELWGPGPGVLIAALGAFTLVVYFLMSLAIALMTATNAPKAHHGEK